MMDPAPQTPEERPRREPGDPLQMSVAEKLACEWEARHDVAARGRILDPTPLQHYFTHARSADHLHPSPPHHRHEGAAREPQHGPAVPPALRGWLRWGEEGGGSSGTIIPRGC